MNNKMGAIIIGALMSLLLASCSAPATTETAGNNNSVLPTPKAGEAEPSELPTETAASPSPSPEPPVAAPEPAKALYRMNDAFRFVPLDDTAPSKAVLLTFDDGPKNEEVLTKILDALDKHKAKAIFFVNGYRVKQNPELLRLIDKRGQTIGNHSYDHINLRDEEEAAVLRQLGEVQEQVEELLGKQPKFFRPPFGSGNNTVREAASHFGMLYMNWSNGSLDWDKSARDKPEVVIANVMEQLHPGANILMHELQWTADALDELLTKLAAEGYSFIDPDTIEVTN